MLYEKLKPYFVDDLLHVGNKIIFILESPHTQEVKNGYPVAGKSGVDISKILFNLDEPFGKLLHEKKITNIGIVNVCNYPLQLSAYKNTDLSKSTHMKYFEKIRQNPIQRKRINPINEVIKTMMDDFKNRLMRHEDKKIVLCGNFAQNTFDSIANEDDFLAVLRVPHPSFNNWKKDKYKDVVKELVEFIS